MSIKNETLRKKLESKRDKLRERIQPWQDEIDLTENMLEQLDAHDVKKAMAAEAKLGLYDGGRAADSGKVTRITLDEQEVA